METGVVKFFLNGEKKNLGFIIADKDGQEIFFHLDRAKSFVCDGSDEPMMVDFKESKPRRYNKIVFERHNGNPKGPSADWWGYLRTYEEASLRCRQRPLYRFIEKIGETAKVRWEGKNLKDLNLIWPKKIYPLKEYVGYASFFEIFLNEEWKPCDDPRSDGGDL